MVAGDPLEDCAGTPRQETGAGGERSYSVTRPRFTVGLLPPRRSTSPAPKTPAAVPRVVASPPGGWLSLLQLRVGAADKCRVPSHPPLPS